MDKGKPGDFVWYVVGATKQRATITAIKGSTHATIRLLTGPQAGLEVEAPWGIIEPAPKPIYTVTPENKVIGPEGPIYVEGNKAIADELAAFLNSKYEFEQALEAALDKQDYPLNGAQWQQLLQRTAIRGEQG